MSARHLQRESLAYFVYECTGVNGTANHSVVSHGYAEIHSSTVYWLALLASKTSDDRDIVHVDNPASKLVMSYF